MTVHWLSPRFVEDGCVKPAGQACFAECLTAPVRALEKIPARAQNESCDGLHQTSKSSRGLTTKEKIRLPFWLAELEDKGGLPPKITTMPKCGI